MNVKIISKWIIIMTIINGKDRSFNARTSKIVLSKIINWRRWFLHYLKVFLPLLNDRLNTQKFFVSSIFYDLPQVDNYSRYNSVNNKKGNKNFRTFSSIFTNLFFLNSLHIDTEQELSWHFLEWRPSKLTNCRQMLQVLLRSHELKCSLIFLIFLQANIEQSSDEHFALCSIYSMLFKITSLFLFAIAISHILKSFICRLLVLLQKMRMNWMKKLLATFLYVSISFDDVRKRWWNYYFCIVWQTADSQFIINSLQIFQQHINFTMCSHNLHRILLWGDKFGE